MPKYLSLHDYAYPTIQPPTITGQSKSLFIRRSSKRSCPTDDHDVLTTQIMKQQVRCNDDDADDGNSYISGGGDRQVQQQGVQTQVRTA